MEHESLLIGLSQIGMIFAGLISVFIIFAAKDGEFPPHEQMHISGLVLSCAALLIASLSPFAFFVYGLDGQLLWRVAAGFSLACCVILSFYGLTPYLKLSAEERKLNGYFHAVTVFGLVGVISILYALAAIGRASSGNYILGTLLIVPIGMSTFTTFAFKRFIRAQT
ncbi:MAG: hypothetical protein AAGJ84_02355 [Pseudomonadota bacterium]